MRENRHTDSSNPVLNERYVTTASAGNAILDISCFSDKEEVAYYVSGDHDEEVKKKFFSFVTS